MRPTTIFVLGLIALAAIGCSRSPKGQLSIELAVDGRTVLKASAEGKKADRLFREHLDLMNALERACDFARFAHEQISTRTSPTAMNSVVREMNSLESKAGISNASESTIYSSRSETSLMITPPEGQIIVCKGASDPSDSIPGCSLHPAGAQPQTQYGLEAKSLLQARYGMKSQAAYVERNFSESKTGKSLESTNAIRINGDHLLCQSSSHILN